MLSLVNTVHPGSSRTLTFLALAEEAKSTYWAELLEFFQYEKTLLVAKLRGARIRARATYGTCEGRKPYGGRDG